MKKIFFLIIAATSFLSLFSQDDTLGYTYYKNSYGNGFNKIQAKQVLRVPRDTIYTKWGWAELNGIPYWGDGTSWHRSLQSFTTGLITGDNVKYDANGDLYNERPTDQQCYNIGNIQIAYRSGLTFDYVGVPYSIKCIQYNLVGGSFTLSPGTADPGEFRFDRVYADNSDPTSLHVITGVNSIGGVGAIPELTDPANQLPVAVIRIDADNAVPTDISFTQVYFNHTRPGEWLFSTNGTITAVPNYPTNPLSPADSSIRITAAANNASFSMTDTVTHSKALYSGVSFYIRNNATYNANRNWIVRLYNGNTQVGNAISATVWGHSKTILNTYMLVNIPMSAFQGTDLFNRIEIRNTGTGGTVNEQVANITLQKGIVIGNPTLTGDYLPKTFNDDQLITGNNHTLIIRDAVTNFKNRDTIGNVINYTAGSALGTSVLDQTATATVATGTGFTTVSGAAYNLNNSFLLNRIVGVENFAIPFSYILPTVNNTNRGVGIAIPYNSQGALAIFHTADTASGKGYWTFTAGNSVSDYAINNKDASQFTGTSGDTIDIKFTKKFRTLSLSAVNRRNGSASLFIVPGTVFQKQGSPAIHFFNAGDTKIVGNIILKYDEILRPDVVALGHSITWGSISENISHGFYRGALAYGNWYGILMGAPGETLVDAEQRLPDVIAANPKVVIIDHVVNDAPLGIDSFAVRLRRISTRLRAFLPNVKFVYGTGVPQDASNLTAFKDSVVVIAAVFGGVVADEFSLSKDPSGTDLNDMWKSGDGIHPNDAWHLQLATPLFSWAIEKCIPKNTAPVKIQAPISNQKGLMALKVNTNNDVVQTFNIGDDDLNVLNRYNNSFTDPQVKATINTEGLYSDRTAFIVPGSGNKTAPVFDVNYTEPNYAFALLLKSQNFATASGFSGFDGGFVRFINNSYIQTLTQPLIVKTLNPKTAQVGVIIKPDNSTGPTGNYITLDLQDRDGVSKNYWDSVGNNYNAHYKDGTGHSADSVLVVKDGYLSVDNVSAGGGVSISDVRDEILDSLEVIRNAPVTLKQKRWTARVGSTTSSATPTINTDNVDIYKLTAQAAAITSFTTNLSGTPVDGDVLEIQITDNGTARAITWGSSFVSSSVSLPTTTVISTTLTAIFQWHTTSSYGNNKWVIANSF